MLISSFFGIKNKEIILTDLLFVKLFLDRIYVNVIIKNGIIENAAGVGIQAIGAIDIILSDLTVRNAGTCISFDNVNGGLIRFCLTKNTGFGGIGFKFSNETSKIVIRNCIAHDNSIAGFMLDNSRDNIFTDCIAIASGLDGTGDGYGFVSNDGRANVFERCHAQSTITTQTNESFVAAGFAFTGSETCSKIIECESFDNTTTTTGFAIPYGILLTSSFNGLDEIQTLSNNISTINAVDWSPDGKFFAIGSDDNTVRVFSLDVKTKQLNGFIEVVNADTTIIRSVKWSSDGNFLAVSGFPAANVALTIYSFSSDPLSLTSVATGTSDTGISFQSVDWDPTTNSRYIAVAGAPVTTNDTVSIFSFNGSSLTLEARPDLGSFIVGQGISWSPDGSHIAAIFSNGTIRNFTYDKNNPTALPITQTIAGAFSDVFGETTIDWSFDAKFLAAVGLGADQLIIYSFDQDTETLTQVEASDQLNTRGNSVNWSPDGNFIGVGDESDVTLFSFSRQNQLLTFQDSASHGAVIRSVSWSPIGNLFAMGGFISATIDTRTYEVLKFPKSNILKNNIIYCNTGNQCPSGFGIAGSSLANLIVGNTAYDNTHNYLFVGNVASNGAPTLLENISVNGFAV